MTTKSQLLFTEGYDTSLSSPLHIRYNGQGRNEDAACTTWNPEAPGPEWILMGIFDTDDSTYVQ
jgi:hypothetical protein